MIWEVVLTVLGVMYQLSYGLHNASTLISTDCTCLSKPDGN